MIVILLTKYKNKYIEPLFKKGQISQGGALYPPGDQTGVCKAQVMPCSPLILTGGCCPPPCSLKLLLDHFYVNRIIYILIL